MSNNNSLLDAEAQGNVDEFVKPVQTHEQLFENFQDLNDHNDNVNEQLINKNSNKIGNNNNINIIINGTNNHLNSNSYLPTDINNAKIWQIQYYQTYFDIDTYSLLIRLRKSMLPFGKNPFFDTELNEKPDLYGPFWIASTLAFMMAAMGNFARFVNRQKSNVAEWNGDIEKISQAATFLYTGLILVPTIIFFILRNFENKQSLIELISLYGYSLCPFIPACILCVIPWNFFDWSIIILATLLSIMFLMQNIYSPLPNDKKQKPGIYILGIIFIVQGGLSLILKVYFFRY